MVTYRLNQTTLSACLWIWPESGILFTFDVDESELCKMVWVLSSDQVLEFLHSLCLLQMTVHKHHTSQSFLILQTVKYHTHLLIRHRRIINIKPLNLKLFQPLSHALLEHVGQVLSLFDAQLPILNSDAIVFYDSNEQRSRQQMLLFT